MSKHNHAESQEQEDVAIVGMAGLYPGAADLQAFWQNIIEKRDCITDPPDDWEAEFYFDPDAESDANDRIYTKKGGFLGDLSRFDPLRHGVVPKSVDGGEPDQFLALELVDRALDNAGLLTSPAPGDRVQIVLGRGTYINRGFTTVLQHGVIVDRVLDILRLLHPEHTKEELQAIKRELKESLPPFNAEMAPGLVPNLVTGRVANRMDFRGVNYIVDAACASSHIATDHSLHDLRSGRCDIAVTGGVHASTPAPIFQIFCQLGAISRKGQIRPFDSDADGTLLAEGLGILVLKRLSDAERDGDRIYALLKSVGTASDGRAVGLLAPRLEGQVLALQRAYESSGIDPHSISLIEAHGTATSVGDATEMAALKEVFGNDEPVRPWCAVGTVKSMIGHCLPAAGSAGIIKTALALYHKVLPPTLHCDNPNPELGLEASPFYINTEARPWIHSGDNPRRAGVSAFGFGSINAHVVLEEYRPPDENSLGTLMRRPDEVIILEADSRNELAVRARNVAEALSEATEIPLVSHAATLNTALEGLDWRLTVVAGSPLEAARKLRDAADKLADEKCDRIRTRDGVYFFSKPLYPVGKIAFLFPGEGSQYRNMLAHLALHYPQVRAWFDLIDRALRDHPRGLLPSEVIFPPAAPGSTSEDTQADADLWRMDIGPEVIFAANQAVFSLLESLGIQPDALAGHSTGEYSALFAAKANVYTTQQQLQDDILALNFFYEKLERAGMIAKGQLINVAAIERYVLMELIGEKEGLTLAMDNCPNQQVVCAHTEEAAEWLEQRLADMGAIFTCLPFDRAYHTKAFQPFCEKLGEFFHQLNIQAPEIPLYSCMSTKPMPANSDAVRKLVTEQWSNRVRFRETVERMYSDGVRIFIECGPRNNLCAFVDDILRGREHLTLPADLEHREGTTQFNHLIAQLAAQGVPMDLRALYTLVSGDDINRQPSVRSGHSSLKLKTALQPMRLNRVPTLKQDASSTATSPAYTEPAFPSLPGLERMLQQTLSPVDMPQQAMEVTEEQDDEVLGAFFNSMESFLDLQHQVMKTYLECPAEIPDIEPHLPVALEDSVRGDTPTAVASGKYPMLGTIQQLVPEKSLETRVSIDLTESIYLEDHTIGRKISKRDPDLHALPVVPLTFSMELMAEAAAALYPNLLVVGMEEVRASQWIALDKSRLELDLSAESEDTPDTRVRVVVRKVQDGNSSNLPPPPLIEGDILLAASRPTPPEGNTTPFRGERQARWKPDEIYSEIMFHGPRLQAIASMDLWGEDGSEGTFVGLPHDRLFQSHRDPQFQTDAISLDNAGQLIGMWTSDHLERAFHVFPFRMESLEIFADNLAPGEKARCRAQIELIGETEVRSDIDLIRSDGQVTQRIKGWWDKRFDLPDRFFQMRRDPARVLLAEPRPDLLDGIDFGENLSCVLLNSLSAHFLESSSHIWLRVLAHLSLNREERETWSEKENNPLLHRVEWLLGRAAVKDAVRELMYRKSKVELYSSDVEIRNAADGHPHVGPTWLPEWGMPPQLSISHKGDVVIALAGTPEVFDGVGIDIENVEPRPDSFIETTFSIHERRLLLDTSPVEHRDELVTRLWCAKEAAGKALHRGLDSVINEITIDSYDDDTQRVLISLGQIQRKESDLAWPKSLIVQTRTLEQGHVIAMAVLSNRER